MIRTGVLIRNPRLIYSEHANVVGTITLVGLPPSYVHSTISRSPTTRFHLSNLEHEESPFGHGGTIPRESKANMLKEKKGTRRALLDMEVGHVAVTLT